MATTKTTDVLLRYRVDQSSANAVRQSIVRQQMELDDLRAELTGVGTSAQRGMAGLRQQFAAGERYIDSVIDDVQGLRAELQRLDDVSVTPEVRVTQTGGGRGGGLDTLDRLGTIGSQIAGGFGSSELGNVAGLIGDVAGGVGALGVAGGVAALAIGAVSLALGDLQKISERAAATAQAQIEGERAAAELAATADRAAQEARREEILRLIAFEESEIAAREARIALNDLNYTNAQTANAMGLTTTNLFQLGQQLLADSDQARESITQSKNTLAALTAEFQGLNAELDVTIDKMVAFTDKTVDFVGKVTKEIDKAALGFLPGTGGRANFGAFQEAEAARLAALQNDRASAYLASVTQTVTAQEQLAKAQTAYNETVDASTARIAEINAKLQADLSEAEAERQRDLAEAANDAGEQRVRAEEQKQAEIARIVKRFDRSYANAVAERDALSATRAEQQRDDELEQLDDRYKDQLKTADDGLKAQQKLINDRYSQQVQTVRAGAEAALRLESQRAQQEINLRQQAVQAATVQLVNALNAEAQIRATYYNQSISQAQAWASLMQLYTSYGLQAPGGVQVVGTNTSYFTGNSATNPYIGYQGGRADGGPMYPGGVYKVGEDGPEYVTPLYPSMVHPSGSGAGGMTINVVGATTDTIRVVSRAQALATFGRVLDQLGVA